jgi:hypothetical protein
MIRKPYSSIALILACIVVLLSACREEALDVPPSNEADSTLTIKELRELFTGQQVRFEQNIAVYATVTMDESSGNIYRNIYLQDETAGINVRMDFASNLREGDRIRLALKGTVLSSYNNMIQLDSVAFGKNVIRQDSAAAIEPETVVITDILSGNYQARLVKLEGVQFSVNDIGKPFANVADGTSENRTLTDCSNNTIIVRTSPFADFANEMVPEGHGSLVAVVSQFGNVWQLLVRHFAEIDMTGERCDSGEPSGQGTFDDPYNVAHAISFNSGNGVWVEGYIIGVMEDMDGSNAPVYGPPFVRTTNILIADDPDEREEIRIMPVQLPIGRAREAINLAENPENLGKPVKLKGNLGAYFVPRPGLRDVSGYWLDGQGIGDGGIWDNLTAMSISQVRALHTGTATSIPGNRMIQGIVISDKDAANITGRNLHIIDENDGTGILLRFASNHNFSLGARIRVEVSGIELSRFNGLLQVTNIPNNQAEQISMASIPEPEETTIANILGNMAHFESRLVKLTGVTVSGGTSWGGSRTLNDGSGTITHFTTNYSTFASTAIPSGQVNLTGIVTVFNVPQINIRNLSDVE